MNGAELREQRLDKYAGFLLSLMDGATTVEMLVDVSAMRPEEVMRVLTGLVTAGIVELKDGVPMRKRADRRAG